MATTQSLSANANDEEARYKAFVERTLAELECGLELDNAKGKKGKIAARFARQKNRSRSAAEKVLEGRFLLGADDASYLASGLGLLWSTVGNKKECGDADNPDLDLAPAVLYMPEATDGIRRGFLKLLQQRYKDLRAGDPKKTLKKLLEYQKILYDLDEVGSGVLKQGQRELLDDPAVLDTPEGRKVVAAVLMQMHAYLRPQQKTDKCSLANAIFQQQRKSIADVQGKAAADVAKMQAEAEQAVAKAQADAQSAIAAAAAANDQATADMAAKQAAEAAAAAAEAKVAEANTQKEAAEAEAKAAETAAKTAEQNEALAKASAVEADEQRMKALLEAKQAKDGAAAQLDPLQKELGELKVKLEQASKTGTEADKALIVELTERITARDAEYAQLKESTDKAIGALNDGLDAAEAAATEANDAKVAAEAAAKEAKQQRDAAKAAATAALEAQTLAEEKATKQCEDAVKAQQKAEEAAAEAQKAQETAEAACAQKNNELEQMAKLHSVKMSALLSSTHSFSEEGLVQAAQTAGLSITAALVLTRHAKTRFGRHAHAPGEPEPTKEEVKTALLDYGKKVFPELEEMEREAVADLAVQSWEDNQVAQKWVSDDISVKEAMDEVASGYTQLTLSNIQDFVNDVKESLGERLMAYGPTFTHMGQLLVAYYLKTYLETNGFLYIDLDLQQQLFGLDQPLLMLAAGDVPVPQIFGSYDDPDVATVVLRGLVGQRGPTEPAAIGTCAQDALLPYSLPSSREMAKSVETVRHILEHTAPPTREEVAHAMHACCAMTQAPSAPKRQRLANNDEVVTVAEALAALGGNFAITGEAAAHADDDRKGVETPHEVRWMPQGPRANTMARVAVLEHAIARCTQVAAQPGTSEEVAKALRGAAATLKLQQLQPLYELKEAAAFDDEPHPLGTATPLVTRPCAVVRGVLSFPTDPGVAPLPAQLKAEGALTDAAKLEQAMGKTAAATATLRNELRRNRKPCHFYVAPPASEMGFREAPTGVTIVGGVKPKTPKPAGAAAAGAGPSNSSDDFEECVSSLDLSPETFMRQVELAAVALQAVESEDPNSEALDPVDSFLKTQADDPRSMVTAQTRREGLWTEFHRHVAISQDRLWVFLRLVSGYIGGDVSEIITMADEATLAATRAIQTQRVEISKRVGDMQAKIVETVVGSMLKSSSLAMDYDNDSKNLTVVDSEAQKKLDELTKGTSGVPFFEANVALRNNEANKKEPLTLSKVLQDLAKAGRTMQTTLEEGLTEPGMASATLAELSHPTNSYFVSMKPDVLAAVREGHEKLNCELAMLTGNGRRLSLWELVEGGCDVLTNRFADFCGFLLVQKRSSTGVSAMYVSHAQIHTNASQARIALARLVAAASVYAARVPMPKFNVGDNLSDTEAADASNKEVVRTARQDALTASERVRDIDVVARPFTLVRSALAAPIPPSGWTFRGPR